MDTAAHVEMLYKKAKDYTETHVQLYKLHALDSTAEVVSSLVSKGLLVLIVASFLLFLNIGLSLYIGNQLDAYYAGFLIMAGVYLLIGILVYMLRRPLVEHPVSDLVISKLRRATATNKHQPVPLLNTEHELQ
ncbi:hypothetical protein [Gilvibacter sediminis]|uniref:hypothetical protein n=1 Tax=Gilvibacter sediminis TaxID=379071 RepID=UPI0023509DE2|nr:hypothetical protein [Gilvibacter sediminis]MDC7999365.1 hypothetical protein [Gilvibacter sediminis]